MSHTELLRWLLVCSLAVAPMVQSAPPVNASDQAASTIILSYSEISSKLADPDTQPRISVYGDGSVQLHYPAYMKSAGDYEFTLNPGELNRLLKSLAALTDFDEKAVKAEKKARQEVRRAQSATGTGESVLHYRSEELLERYEIELVAANSVGQLKRDIRWKNLKSDTRLYPEIEALQDLAALQSMLEQFLARRGNRINK